MGRRANTTFLTFLAASVLSLTGLASDADAQAEGRAKKALPPLEAIVEAVDANSQQAAVLGQAYEKLVASTPGMRGRQQGPRGKGSQAGAGERTRPFRAFLADSAGALDHGQMVSLIELMGESRDAWREERGDEGSRRGKGMGQGQDRGRGAGQGQGQGRHEPLHTQLDLSEEQQKKVEAAYDKTRESLQELGDDRREKAQDEREVLQKELQSILTETQWDQLTQLRSERRLGNAVEADERFEKRLEGQMTFLTAVLALSEDQQGKVKTALSELQAQRSVARRSKNWAEGGPKMGGGHMREEMEAGRAEAHEALKKLLNKEQLPVFEALTELALDAEGHGPGQRGRGQGHRGGQGRGR